MTDFHWCCKTYLLHLDQILPDWIIYLFLQINNLRRKNPVWHFDHGVTMVTSYYFKMRLIDLWCWELTQIVDLRLRQSCNACSATLLFISQQKASSMPGLNLISSFTHIHTCFLCLQYNMQLERKLVLHLWASQWMDYKLNACKRVVSFSTVWLLIVPQRHNCFFLFLHKCKLSLFSKM